MVRERKESAVRRKETRLSPLYKLGEWRWGRREREEKEKTNKPKRKQQSKIHIQIERLFDCRIKRVLFTLHLSQKSHTIYKGCGREEKKTKVPIQREEKRERGLLFFSILFLFPYQEVISKFLILSFHIFSLFIFM